MILHAHRICFLILAIIARQCRCTVSLRIESRRLLHANVFMSRSWSAVEFVVCGTIPTSLWSGNLAITARWLHWRVVPDCAASTTLILRRSPTPCFASYAAQIQIHTTSKLALPYWICSISWHSSYRKQKIQSTFSLTVMHALVNFADNGFCRILNKNAVICVVQIKGFSSKFHLLSKNSKTYV